MEISDTLKKVQALKISEPDEDKPYDHLYKAAAICEEAISGIRKGDEIDHQLLHVLLARQGLLLLETDLLADGQAVLEGALPWLETNLTSSLPVLGHADQQQAHNLPLLLECYNALGALQSGRSDFDAALSWLRKAEALYKSVCIVPPSPLCLTDVTRPDQSGSISSSETPSEASASDLSNVIGTPSTLPPDSNDVETQYTSTLFYLAQVYAHAEQKDKSAEYCAITLRRQLEGGEYQLNEWIQNCMQLAGYFTSSNAFAIGQYYVMAAGQVAKMSATRRLTEHASTKNAELQDLPMEKEANIPPALDADVGANMELAWAKLSLQRLVSSYDRRIRGESAKGSAGPSADEESALFTSPGAFPDSLKFKTLDLPALDTLPWGEAAFINTFEQARDAFNAGMLRYKAALEHYVLDGCVTEHCNIIMEISNMYRCLAGFEADIHRQRLMQRQRASRLEALHGVLNPEHYLGLVRSIALELGNIYREISELEEAEGRPATKAASARRDAIRYYREFVDSFRSPKDPSGALPGSGKVDRVEDSASERYLVQASFALGRLLSRALDMEAMVQASDQLKWTSDYIGRFNLSEFKREAEMALEMSALIMEKAELNKQVAALPSKS